MDQLTANDLQQLQLLPAFPDDRPPQACPTGLRAAAATAATRRRKQIPLETKNYNQSVVTVTSRVQFAFAADPSGYYSAVLIFLLLLLSSCVGAVRSCRSHLDCPGDQVCGVKYPAEEPPPRRRGGITTGARFPKRDQEVSTCEFIFEAFILDNPACMLCLSLSSWVIAVRSTYREGRLQKIPFEDWIVLSWVMNKIADSHNI